MTRRLPIPALAAALLALTATAASAAPTLTGVGVWRNPKDSVHIALKPCGGDICGFVIWANAKAEAAAKKGGNSPLVGQQLLRGFKVDKNGIGRGKVFIPDMNATFSGSAELIDERTMRARGCLAFNVLCKSQLWTRIDGVPS